MNLNNWRVGTRLAAGFAVTLVFLALMMVFSIWHLKTTATAMRQMMATPLAKERLLEEQLRNVAIGVTRGKAIARSADPSLEALFSDEAKASTARGNEILKTLGDMLTSPAEKDLLEGFSNARKAYLKARDTMMAAKRAGNSDEATRIYDKEFLVVAPAYVASLQAMLDYQRKAIDEMSATITANADTSGGAAGGPGRAGYRVGRGAGAAADPFDHAANGPGHAAGRCRGARRFVAPAAREWQRRNRPADACAGPDEHRPAYAGNAGAPVVRKHPDGQRRNRARQPRPVGPHRKPGQRAGTNRRQHGRTELHGETERRQRTPGEPSWR